MRRAWRALALLPALVCCAAAWSQEATGLTTRSPWSLLGQALLSLLIVVGVICLVYFGLRRLTDRQVGAGVEGPLRVLQACHLGGDRWLYLIEVEERRLVVGGTGSGLALLAELQPSGKAGRDEV